MTEQLLAAHNSLMGTTNILVIGVPEGWQLREGYGQPEVDIWAEYQEHRWMRGGHAVYRLVEPHPDQPGLVRTEVELSITTSSTMALALGGERMTVCGHAAARFQGTVPKGLFPRYNLPAVTVEWTCPETHRLVRVVVNGIPRAPVDREVLGRLMDGVLAGVQCH